MKKNVAGQVIGAQMVNATDGSAFAGAVTVHVTGNAGTQAAGSVGSGACTHEGNGFHTYAPAQAETNYDHIGFTFVGTGAVPATVQVYPTFPQTGDNFARLGAPAGASVSADVAAVKAKTDLIPTDPADQSDIATAFAATDAGIAAIPTADENADALLNRNLATGADSGSPTVRTVRQALRFLRNRWAVSGSTLTVYKEDDATPSWTSAVATSAGADPVTGSDPAGP